MPQVTNYASVRIEELETTKQLIRRIDAYLALFDRIPTVHVTGQFTTTGGEPLAIPSPGARVTVCHKKWMTLQLDPGNPKSMVAVEPHQFNADLSFEGVL